MATDFDYYDQFSVKEIDLSPYIQRFSKDDYTIELSNFQPIKTTISNLFEKLDFKLSANTSTLVFETISVVEGQKIEHVAAEYYGNKDYWWIILMLNEIKNPIFDWPMMDNQLKELAEVLVEKENKYPYEIYYKLLFEKNEEKRSIIVVKPEYVDDLIDEIKNYKVE